METVVKQQLEECISEISRYSTVWSGKRVIIHPIHHRKVLSISINCKSDEFAYNEIEKAAKYILSNLK